MQDRPIHGDIKKYGYFLQYSPSKDKWYAAYDTQKGATWYMWNNTEKLFKMLMRYQDVPNDLIKGEIMQI